MVKSREKISDDPEERSLYFFLAQWSLPSLSTCKRARDGTTDRFSWNDKSSSLYKSGEWRRWGSL